MDETGEDAAAVAAMNAPLLEKLRAGGYDFLDVGTRDGGGFYVGAMMGSARGVGLDIDLEVARAGRAKGWDVLCMDARRLAALGKVVEFSVCHHVLEHLEDIHDVAGVLKSLAGISRDYIVVAGPNFATEAWLYERGLKAIHSAMPEHLCRFRIGELTRVLEVIGLRHYAIGLVHRMENSDGASLVSSIAPNDVRLWEQSRALPRPAMVFAPPLYRDFVCVIALRDGVDPVERLGRYAFTGETPCLSLLRQPPFDAPAGW